MWGLLTSLFGIGSSVKQSIKQDIEEGHSRTMAREAGRDFYISRDGGLKKVKGDIKFAERIDENGNVYHVSLERGSYGKILKDVTMDDSTTRHKFFIQQYFDERLNARLNGDVYYKVDGAYEDARNGYYFTDMGIRFDVYAPSFKEFPPVVYLYETNNMKNAIPNNDETGVFVNEQQVAASCTVDPNRKKIHFTDRSPKHIKGIFTTTKKW